MTSPTSVLPVEHTVDGLMKLVDSYRYKLLSDGHADMRSVRQEAYAAIRLYAERLASPNTRMLTDKEIVGAILSGEMKDSFDYAAIQRKFAEVNGLKLAGNTPIGGQQE
jgi:hypothetical protein